MEEMDRSGTAPSNPTPFFLASIGTAQPHSQTSPQRPLNGSRVHMPFLCAVPFAVLQNLSKAAAPLARTLLASPKEPYGHTATGEQSQKREKGKASMRDQLLQGSGVLCLAPIRSFTSTRTIKEQSEPFPRPVEQNTRR